MSKESRSPERHVGAFLEMLSAERGAARNTLDAYERDLEDFAGFLSSRGGSLDAATPRDIRDYLDKRVRASGYRGDALFSSAAVRGIERYSGGLLRRPNSTASTGW